jgi:hypothetical protein
MYNQMRGWPDPPPVASIVTQTIVDREDPSFKNPSKPIGSFMTEIDAVQHRDRDLAGPSRTPAAVSPGCRIPRGRRESSRSR